MNSRNYKTEPIKENPHKVEVRQMYADARILVTNAPRPENKTKLL